MLPAIEYLEFAGRYFGRSEYDLATSGITPIMPDGLGANPAPADFGARERFVAALARRYAVPAAEVVPCLGTSGALYTACAGLLAPGDGVLVESPVYEPLWRIPQGLGAEVRHFERVRTDDYAIDTGRVLSALQPGTRLVIVTNPHNPSNALSDARSLGELASALAERGVRLLVDEAYLELFAPATTARGIGPNVLTCSSATKCWGVPWARAGWLLAPQALSESFGYVERHVVGLAPPLCWALGERAVLVADELLTRAHELQQDKRPMVDAFMARMADLFSWCPPPPAGVFGWVEARDGRSLSAELDRARREHGVLVAPGAFFGSDAAFRLSWVAAASRVEPALSRLEDALRVDSGSLP